ncbi:MAG TPA: response regulator [Verrucomicrobiales bacterium]|jgi:CheY-like chemotaxis protein|nr:response regulator [Verrucomicrobiales bacterium]
MPGKKILVVEDHKDSCLWISAVLRQSGFIAVEAGDGTLAVRLAHSEEPDVILLDMHLPCGGGDFVLESLQRQPTGKKIPVIIMSGDSELDEDALREMGAVAVFRKPVDVHAFLRAIKEWTGKEVPELTPA